MLRDNGVIGDVLPILRAKNFYLDAHQKIFSAITALYDRGHPVDLVVLAERLKDEKFIEDVGGYGHLGELWNAAPTAANAEYYAAIVRDKARLRALVRVGQQIAADALDQAAPAEELVEQAEAAVFAIAEDRSTSRTVTMQEMIRAAKQRIDDRHARRSEDSLGTGFIDLDRILAGFHPGELVYVAARPSIGKTALGLAIAHHVAVEEQKPVFFVSAEQSSIELGERLLVAQAQVDSHHVRRGMCTREECERLVEAGDDLSGGRLFVEDGTNQTTIQIAARARRLKRQHGIALAIVDYVQLIEPDGNGREPRHEQVARISRRLKHLARELHVPVVALAQLNRAAEDRARPRISDLRESGSLEQDADTVMLLQRPDEPRDGDPTYLVQVIVAKQRNGPIGEATLVYRRRFMRFENYMPGDD
jgi:replicative DNA helicase